MAQQLILKEQFGSILEKYQPDARIIKALQKTKIALFDGPSASGRNTIMARLVESGGYQQIVSDTTRRPRVNNGVLEVSGKEYWFKSEVAFLDDLKKGNYIEAAIIHGQQVSGVSFKEIERAAAVDKIAINDIQPDGIEAFRRYKPDTICIFVIPPDFQTWLMRLNTRGKMLPEERKRRFESAIYEIKHALASDYYKFIINDDLDSAVKQAHFICNEAQLNTQTSRYLATKLLASIENHLS